MIDDMDHRILEHQLRRRRLVETILRVRPMVDILDAQHRVRIPQLIGFQGFAEEFEQRASCKDDRTGRTASWPWRD